MLDQKDVNKCGKKRLIWIKDMRDMRKIMLVEETSDNEWDEYI